MAPGERAQFDSEGYLVFPEVLDKDMVEAVRRRLEDCEREARKRTEAERVSAGLSLEAYLACDDPVERDRVPREVRERVEEIYRVAGARVQRDGTVALNNMHELRDEVLDRLWLDPRVLACMAQHLGDFRTCLSGGPVKMAPGAGRTGWHTDWRGRFSEQFMVVKWVWMISDFTAQNGATRVVPGSHLLRRRPHDDPFDGDVRGKDSDKPTEYPSAVRLEGPAGSLAVMNGYIWHTGGKNTTAEYRLAVFGGGEHRSTVWHYPRTGTAPGIGLSDAARYLSDSRAA